MDIILLLLRPKWVIIIHYYITRIDITFIYYENSLMTLAILISVFDEITT